MGSGSGNDIRTVPKRSLFKRSAWAKPAETEEAVGLFSRSKEIFPEFVAENVKQRKKLERSRSSVSTELVDQDKEQGKRRRISNESDDIGGSSTEDELAAGILRRHRSSGTATPPLPKTMQASPSPKQTVSPKRRSVTSSTRVTRGSQVVESAAILLSDSEGSLEQTTKCNNAANLCFDDSDEEDVRILKPLKPATLPPVETLSSEDEYAEFVTKARAKSRRKAIETTDLTKSIARSEASDSSKPESPELILQVKSQPPAHDPIIAILVTSAIEGTKPLLVKRRLSQRLKDVRIGWCDKQMIGGQPVPESTKRQIFLTWRGNKVFDVTTCQAMGLKVNPQGKVVSEGEGIDTEGRIHLEAWTEDIFDEYKKRRAAERKRRALIPLEEEKEEQHETETANSKEESRKFKVILKSKEYQDLKLKVSSTTTVAKIIAGFRSQYKIPGEKDVSLHLDGDQLEPTNLLSTCDVDIDDTTTIDVHVS